MGSSSCSRGLLGKEKLSRRQLDMRKSLASSYRELCGAVAQILLQYYSMVHMCSEFTLGDK